MSLIAFWNLSLGRLGDTATVGAPEERSRQAELCRQFYPDARRAVQEMRDWNFCTRIAPLAELTGFGSKITYQFPANALRVFRVGDEHTMLAGADAKGADYEVVLGGSEERVVLTDVYPAYARYTVDVSDTTRWSPLFREALSWYLASQLAGPLIQGEAGRAEAQRCLQVFSTLLGQAERSDANQKQDEHSREAHVPLWMKGRGPAQTQAQPPYPRWIRPEINTDPGSGPGPAPEPYDFASFYNSLPDA